MTVAEFEEWDKAHRYGVAKCYDADGVRRPEGDLRVMVHHGGGLRLKTDLTRWDQWRDRRWERRTAARVERG